MDPLIADYFENLRRRHRESGYLSDMPAFANAIGVEYFRGGFSVTLPGGRIQVRRTAPPIQQRADAAHELAHSLADEGGHDALFRHYHVSVPDMNEHIEEIMDHGGDLLLMPDSLVEEIVNRRGWTARAVWELSEFAWVSPTYALRRLTHYREDARCAGFIAKGSYIQHAHANHFTTLRAGSRVPEPNLTFEHGLTLYAVPKTRQVIGLIDSSEAAD